MSTENTKWQDAVKDVIQTCRTNEKFDLITTLTPKAAGSLANVLEHLAKLSDAAETHASQHKKD